MVRYAYSDIIRLLLTNMFSDFFVLTLVIRGKWIAYCVTQPDILECFLLNEASLGHIFVRTKMSKVKKSIFL